ncbi:caveolin-2-like isoform X2 [Cherax quadricarinatus]|uniref:caveolin-2-like isoform X2 n=1 Tax=Cherax quadricarinatus TaxID=27406 RepID=UPI00387E5486
MLVEGPVDPNKLEGEESSHHQENKKDSAKEKKRKGNRMGGGTPSFAMNSRDPNNINSHIQIQWDDIIAEPEGLRTPDACWNCANRCYDRTEECCYVFLVIIFAPFIAFANGCQFACLAFNQVWCVGPCLRCWKINCATIRKYWETCLVALCSPVAEMCGLIFSKAYVRYQRLPDGSATQSSDYFNV